jgi:anti-anti-sigma regulatory factor
MLTAGPEPLGAAESMAKDSGKIVALPAIVDLDALDLIRDELIDAVESGPVRVAGKAVERVSTNALFMLLSAAETARRNNFGFAVSEPSASFQAAVERLGIGAQFAPIMEGL